MHDETGRRARRHRFLWRPARFLAAALAPAAVAASLAPGGAGHAAEPGSGGQPASEKVLAEQVGAATQAAPPWPGLVTGDVTVHDPSMVRTPQGYLLASTHNAVEARTSPDRIAFTRRGSALGRVPLWAWLTNFTGDVWAPDVSFHNGTYYLYYSASGFGSNNSTIGLATSTTGAPGSFRDRGIVYRSTGSDDFNAIDPSLFVDPGTGRWWLSFGSHWSGIHMISIDPATGMQSWSDRTRYHVARRPQAPGAVESPYILSHDGWYYLFTSFDTCCQGVNSTYRVMAGRSRRPTGPYVDRSGRRLLDGGGTQVLASHGHVRGPGGQSVLSDVDGDLLVYHYYDARAGGRETLGVTLIGWDAQGWPYVH